MQPQICFTGLRVIRKYCFGKVSKRRPVLAGYKQYSAIRSAAPLDTRRRCIAALKQRLTSLKHNTGLHQLLDSDTDTASEGDDEHPEMTKKTPEEIVIARLQVSTLANENI